MIPELLADLNVRAAAVAFRRQLNKIGCSYQWPSLMQLIGKRGTVATIAFAIIASIGGQAQSYQITQKANQPEAIESGRVTTEAAVISVIRCNGQGENGGQFYIYQYTKRPGFRAIQPPNWSSPIGGRDFPNFEQAAAAACAGPVSTSDPLAPLP